MKLSINDKGMLVYKLGVLSVEERNAIEVTFEDGTENFALSLPKLKDISRTEIYSYEEIINVPVVSMRSFFDKSAFEQFIESAETIKNSKVSILVMAH